MFKFFSKLKRKYSATNKTVEVGAVYVLKQNQTNTFKHAPICVTVKDVPDDWVLYTMHPLGGMFQNECEEVELFLSIYKKKNLE